MQLQFFSFDRLLRNNIFRLSALFSVLFFVASSVMLAVAYKTMDKNIEQSIEDQVDSEISRYIGSYQSSQVGIKASKYAFFIEQDGQKVAGNITKIPDDTTNDNKTLVEVDANSLGTKDKGDIVGKVISLPDNTKLFIGKNSYGATRRQKDIIDALSSSLTSLLLIGITGGLFISYRSIRRIDRISKISQEIMAGNLNLRIPVEGHNDDIEDLTLNLNRMLDQIDDLMQGMKEVSNNIAHDLRTPLTRLRGHLETISRHSTKETQIEAENAIKETDSLLATFSSLLRISQIESGAVNAKFVDLNLGEVCHEIIDFYEVLAEEKEQELEISLQEDIHIKGDKSMIAQAFVNILTNAVKYTPDHGKIRIQLEKKDQYALITIHDNGDGVPDELLDKISDRFFRQESHRNQANGNGLGLPLVKAIIKSHNGELSFQNDNGLCVNILLPLITDKKTAKKTVDKLTKKQQQKD